MASTPRLWFQQEFPWLDWGFIHAVDERHEHGFVQRLVELGFSVVVLDPDPAGPAARLGLAFAVALYDALGFTDHEPVALSWDAVHDHFAAITLPPRFALLWRRADDFAKRQTKTFAEACSMLAGEFEQQAASQAVLILSGHGPEFRTPRDIRRP